MLLAPNSAHCGRAPTAYLHACAWAKATVSESATRRCPPLASLKSRSTCHVSRPPNRGCKVPVVSNRHARSAHKSGTLHRRAARCPRIAAAGARAGVRLDAAPLGAGGFRSHEPRRRGSWTKKREQLYRARKSRDFSPFDHSLFASASSRRPAQRKGCTMVRVRGGQWARVSPQRPSPRRACSPRQRVPYAVLPRAGASWSLPARRPACKGLPAICSLRRRGPHVLTRGHGRRR